MSNFDLFLTLQGCGKSLALLLDEAKSKSKDKTPETPIYNRVETAINGLINDLNLSKDGEFTTEECFDKVIKKIEWTLGELTKHDTQNASGYVDLATTLGTFVSTYSQTLATSVSTHKTNNKKNNSNSNVDTNQNNNVQETDINLENLYSSLNPCQIILLELFVVLPRGTELKENDLFLSWYSETEINIDPKRNVKTEFAEDLKKLVEMKQIEPVAAGVGSVRINNKREGIKYIMPNIIWTKFQEIIDSYEKFRVTRYGIVANTDACNLTTKMLDSIATKYVVKMLQLGSWNNDPTKYIVVEDMDALTKALKRPMTRFLNLQGVSGLVELPSLATMADNLKVLNLKGCHNLESLSPLFNTLRKWELGYLDISECYLLDHLPNALSGCTKLRVLKGFVLPKEPHHPFISTPLQFQHLWKLTLRTKRLNFPTKSDLGTLCELQSLTHLKITWVGACSSDDNEDVQFDDNSKFPPKLTKFEMEAASDSTSTKILDLIARQKEAAANVPGSDTSPVSLKKLYIKGGNLSKLEHNVDCKILRLQYLPNMQHSCYDMMRTFPALHRLEMSKDVMYSMLRQSFQKATGTNDQNSGWEPSFTRHAAPSSTS